MIKNVFPIKPKFKSGESIEIVACLEKSQKIDDGFLVFSLFKQDKLIERSEVYFDDEKDKYGFQFLIKDENDKASDYKVEVDFFDNMGYLETSSTAINIMAWYTINFVYHDMLRITIFYKYNIIWLT